MPREATVRRTDDTAAQASDSQNAALDEGRARGENTVVLVGKAPVGPADRQLPSGDMLVPGVSSFVDLRRLVVACPKEYDRPASTPSTVPPAEMSGAP